jgi:hypothetical protein
MEKHFDINVQQRNYACMYIRDYYFGNKGKFSLPAKLRPLTEVLRTYT